MRPVLYALAAPFLIPTLANSQESKYYDVPKGDFPHDVAARVSGGCIKATGDAEFLPGVPNLAGVRLKARPFRLHLLGARSDLALRA
jgi:hypothetical protein